MVKKCFQCNVECNNCLHVKKCAKHECLNCRHIQECLQVTLDRYKQSITMLKKADEPREEKVAEVGEWAFAQPLDFEAEDEELDLDWLDDLEEEEDI